MRSLQKDLQRVFIHEIGHFVAAELNYSLFNYDRRIEKFTLHPSKDSTFFNGEVYTSKATLDKYSIETCANEYAQTFYGCLFESIFREIPLNLCLKSSVTKKEHLIYNIGNGKVDALNLFCIGNRKEIKRISNLWYEYIFDYFEKMKSLKNHFDFVFKIDVNDFILKESNSNKYIIDIDKLTIDLQPFLDSHKPYYKSLIGKLSNIQNQYI